MKIKPWQINYKDFAKKSNGTYGPSKGYWRSRRRLHWINKWMYHNKCNICKTNKQYTLQLDHLNPNEKLFEVLNTGNGILDMKSKIKILILEIRKCQILCANCHRIKTRKNKEGGRKLHNEQQKLNDFNKYQLKLKERTADAINIRHRD